MIKPVKNIITEDVWSPLRSFTAARIALGKTGISLPAKESLAFKMAHAHARDAVYSHLEKEKISTDLNAFRLPVFFLESMAYNRAAYLQRPDLGRKLSDTAIKNLSDYNTIGYDLCVCIADGLSSQAVNLHAVQLLRQLMPLLQQHVTIAPFCIVEQGRVAISDDIAVLLKAKLSLILIGERPGLTAADSMGAYLTYAPVAGLTDECRNCVSNIRPEGLQYDKAAEKIYYLVREALRLKITGVALKDNDRQKTAIDF